MISGLSSASSYATAGVQAASSRFNQAAESVASGGDIASGSVAMSSASVQLQASIAVEKTSNQMMGSLLNLLA